MSTQEVIIKTPAECWGYKSLSVMLSDDLTRITVHGIDDTCVEKVYTSIKITSPVGYEWLRGTHCLAAVVTEILHGCCDGAMLNGAILATLRKCA